MLSGSLSHQSSFTMPSLSEIQWTFFWLLLFCERLAGVEVRCPLSGPVGPQHPVQGLLERFKAGPGCAARERGNKETHVIALRRVTNSPENKVTVLLKPLCVSTTLLRPVHLVLSSKLPVVWLLKAERLPHNLPVLVQLSAKSNVESHTLPLHVQMVHSLPIHPLALHRWALKHHGNLSSLTHTTHGNRVYIRLGEDPTLPSKCKLQSTFLSHNYMTSDLQQQAVQGCAYTTDSGESPEVHVIKLHSAGSGLRGCLQVEVTVSLVPPVASASAHKVVLILSSLVPVSWAISAHGVRGCICVHSSNSVSLPHPPEPNLTLSSKLDSGLIIKSDLLVWANERGYNKVTSYTEAQLANHFVIQLAEGGTDEVALMNSLVMRPLWVEERRLREWLNTGEGQESFIVNCEGGLLSVTVDQQSLQSLSVPVAAVTLRDPRCQALSNGSHFLLTLPVIFCGTEAMLLGEPRGVQYKNMVLLWRDEPQTAVSLSDTEKSERPLSIHISCFVAIPLHPADDDNVTLPLSLPLSLPLGRFPRGLRQGPKSGPGPSHLPAPRHNSEPALLLNLFVTESYKQTWIGPCVISANHRVYVEISAKVPNADFVQVKSCFLSPVSDPKKFPFWTVISNGCSSDPSLTIVAKKKDEQEEGAEGDGEPEEAEGLHRGRNYHKGRKGARIHKGIPKVGGGGGEQPLRFSFILQAVFNDSMQFLHCSVLLCLSGSTRGEPIQEAVKNRCHSGIHIPPLVSRSPNTQCAIRNLSRPMVVTHPISSLAPKTWGVAGEKNRIRSIAPVASPDPEPSSPVLQTGLVMGIAFAAFAIGVSLMGGLWCIYNYTEL
ncbi:transforming growth factor beta receptor type 3 isoform X2 [Leuresthes tenuis]|uniref:transforming growth factor beta receptor type 3 isoform X2 n=1 Tax=Leuresthes tenuis TaxID=355514 RepID=UPI003B514100